MLNAGENSRGWLHAHGELTLRSSLLQDVMQHRFVVRYRRLGATYWSHLQGSTVEETLVTNYQSTLHNIPEDQRSHLRGRSVKSRITITIVIFQA